MSVKCGEVLVPGDCLLPSQTFQIQCHIRAARMIERCDMTVIGHRATQTVQAGRKMQDYKVLTCTRSNLHQCMDDQWLVTQGSARGHVVAAAAGGARARRVGRHAQVLRRPASTREAHSRTLINWTPPLLPWVRQETNCPFLSSCPAAACLDALHQPAGIPT